MRADLPTTVMVISDSNFHNLCDQPDEYVAKLQKVIKSRLGENTKITTIAGRYGLTKTVNEFDTFDIEDRNKTLFVQTIENNVNYFDELVIVSLTDKDPFIEGVADCMLTHHKNIVRYAYKRRE